MANLLIVDDDEFICSLTRELLENCGHQVETAADGCAAWALLDSDPQRFELILLDRQMPRMDGMTLLKHIKSDARLLTLPVIMLTGDHHEADIIEGLAEGANYYLTKPSAENVLKLIVKNTLAEAKKKTELLVRLGRQHNNLGLLHSATFRYRTLSEAKELALLLAELSLQADRTVHGYSELLINAVEHGNLAISYAEKSRLLHEGRWEAEIESRLQQAQYASLQVEVTMHKTAEACVVTISDQGCGFNWQDYVEFNPERIFDLHGRGIAMSKAVSFDQLEYQGNGNKVVTSVKLN